ncbi:MAG TPA: fumarylacetoacetate hydrolase family protein [Pyrinomonadaceae bacterium]|jgi:2-keto-4-pentenoate hydratase/2-oxohepta-3-ene-1,7-dioic acid hydratase in catechol pathway|nr:fumarylacetoacetate hydrolase family protein [Pyrinomonadaceae bacterium]
MRIANFTFKDGDIQTPRPGVVIADEVVDLRRISESASVPRAAELDGARDMLSLISKFPDIRAGFFDLLERAGNEDAIRDASTNLNNVKLTAPVERPGKIICLAGNYREHIKESGYVAPEQADVITQQLFIKPSTSIIGNDDEILITKSNVRVGWETELAVVVGKRGKNIPSDSAHEYVFGYTILNDVSERGLNSRIENRKQREMDRFLDWLAGKWFDTFAPCGPWIVTPDQVGDPHNLNIQLTINGEVRQRGNTRDMLFSIPEQIAYASTIMTLEPGDIISTGTPAGAGTGGGDSSLHDGDELVCEIEKIGMLKNRVRYVD